MAKKDKESDVRTDASGRELLPHEVSPAEQAENPIAEEGETPEAEPKGQKKDEN